MSLKDILKDVAHEVKEVKLNRAASSAEESANNRKILRPLRRANYCQTKIRGKKTEEKSNADMCLEKKTGTAGQAESLPGETQSCVSTFNSEGVKGIDPASKTNVVSSSKHDTRKRKTMPLSDVNNTKEIIEKAVTVPSTTNSSDDENQQIPTVSKNKQDKSCMEKKCTLCEKIFPDSHSYTVHLKEEHKSNTRQSHVCSVCGKELSSASSLDRHLLTHSGERPHTCPICSSAFTTNGNMNRHVRTHGNMNGHVKTHKRKMSVGEKSKDPPTKKRKISSENNTSTSCNDGENELTTSAIHECNDNKAPVSSTESENEEKTFDTEFKTPDPSIESENKVHECTDCIKGFKDLTYLGFSTNKFPLYGRLDCENRKRCPFGKNTNADETNSPYNFPKECKKCELLFPCSRSLDCHLEAHSHDDFLICKICRSGFLSIDAFQRHELLHKVSVHKVKMNSDSERMKHKDDFMLAIGLFNKKRANFKYSEEEKPQCTKSIKENFMSQKDFNSKTAVADKGISVINLKPDYQTNNNDLADISSIVSLTCKSSVPNFRIPPITPTSAPPDEMLQDNQIRVIPTSPQSDLEFSPVAGPSHSSDNVLTTPSAVVTSSNDQISYVETSDESLHVLASDAENSKSGANLDAWNASSSITDLKSHRNLKDLKSKKHSKKTIHKCSDCPYKSSDKSTLLRHTRTHTGCRPYVCRLCNYRFTTKANTNRHIIKIHGKKGDEANNYAVYDGTKTENSPNDNKVLCDFCKTGFDNGRALQHHLRSTSSRCTQKPFTCKLCNSGFTKRNNCVRHITNQHKRSDVQQLIQINKMPSGERGSDSEDENEQVLNLADNEASTSCDEREQCSNNVQNPAKEHNTLEENINDAEITALVTENFRHAQSSPVHSDVVEVNSEVHSDVAKVNSKVHSDQTLDQPPLDQTSQMYSKTVYPKLNTSEDDTLSAVDGLMSLYIPIQKNDNFQVLDLSLRPIDLSSKKSNIQEYKSTEFKLKHSDVVPLSGSLSNLPPQAHTSVFKPQNINYSQTLNIEPINLCKKTPPLPIYPTPIHYSCLMSATPCGFQKSSEADLFDKKASKKDIGCQICGKFFSNKSNKERHVRRKHPEYIQSTSNNFVPMLVAPEFQKQAKSVSDTTKDRLRSVLIPKVNTNNFQSSHDDDESTDSETALYIVENTVTDSSDESCRNEDGFLKIGSKNDCGNNDLASVTAVINTANSPGRFFEYLNHANSVDANLPKTHTIGAHGVGQSNGSGKAKRHICKNCGNDFSSSSALERHMLTHTGIKNFACSKCDKKFTTKSNRDRHEKKPCCPKSNFNRFQTWDNALNDQSAPLDQGSNHYDNNNNFVVGALETGKTDKPQNGENTLNHSSHSILNLSFAKRHSNFHLNTAVFEPLQSLTSEQNFECKICNNTYKSYKDLNNHMKQLHPLEYRVLTGDKVVQEKTIPSLERLIKRKSL